MDDQKRYKISLCPVCRYDIGIIFFYGGSQPLAILGWPQSVREAESMQRFKLEYLQCPNCTHVWNDAFSYDDIPYQKNPMRMFNQGGAWQGHLGTTRDLVISKLSDFPTVIDIGCGEGHFVRGVAEKLSSHGRFIGFDPDSSNESGNGLEFYSRLFDPLSDINEFKPDMVILRHVIEHLTNPAEFLRKLAWGSAKSEKELWLFAEVPCIDRVFETDRLSDFYYEHPSQFTSKSFKTLMEMGGEVVDLDLGYGGEVIFALVKLGVPAVNLERSEEAYSFWQRSMASKIKIEKQLVNLDSEGKRVAIWGGTGKAAAFINHYDATKGSEIIVVDSDKSKVGTFVPGSGKEIYYRDELKNRAIDVVIIPPQWRAKDIVTEMEREGIVVEKVLIEHNGGLIDFEHDAHPYK